MQHIGNFFGNIGKAFVEGVDKVIGVIASTGSSQTYGYSKIVKMNKQICQTEQEIQKITTQIEKLRQPLQSEGNENTALKTISSENVSEIQELERMKDIAQKKLQVQQESRELGKKAMTPFIGASLVAQDRGYKSEGCGFLSVMIEESLPSEPIASTILFPGQEVGWNSGLWNVIHGQRVILPVSNGNREIEGVWVLGEGCKETDRTVVLYHGNGMTLYDMYNYAYKYHKAGFNVLATTLGGKQYQQIQECKNNQEISTSELTMYADVDAEMKWLESKGVKEVGVHGLSIGGAKAFQAAKKYGAENNNPTIKVKFIVADQTFTTAGAVSSNVGDKIAGLGDIGRLIGQSAVPRGETDGYNMSDGLNNLVKAESLQKSDVELFCIEASEDILMGKNEGNFALDLFKMRYPLTHQELFDTNYLVVQGPHCAFANSTDFEKIMLFANKICPNNK